MTVVGDLGTKVVEQLIEADAARNNAHFGDHRSRHEYSNENYPLHINRAMRKIWFAYADLGYDGVNGKRAQAVVSVFGRSLLHYPLLCYSINPNCLITAAVS